MVKFAKFDIAAVLLRHEGDSLAEDNAVSSSRIVGSVGEIRAPNTCSRSKYFEERERKP